MSEYWMSVIDFGAPWSWLAVFFLSSSFALRKKVSPIKFVMVSLAGAFATWMAFWVLWFFSMPFFDPYLLQVSCRCQSSLLTLFVNFC